MDAWEVLIEHDEDLGFDFGEGSKPPVYMREIHLRVKAAIEQGEIKVDDAVDEALYKAFYHEIQDDLSEDERQERREWQ